jgi:hypothetical protein
LGYTALVWEVEYTDEFGEWWETLTKDQQNFLDAAIDKLQIAGPALGRPLADTVSGSRYPNMKELRPIGSHIRVFFAFDPLRTAILLIGGDKSGRWKKFYDEMIPVADALYEEHIEQLRREGVLE